MVYTPKKRAADVALDKADDALVAAIEALEEAQGPAEEAWGAGVARYYEQAISHTRSARRQLLRIGPEVNPALRGERFEPS